MKHSLHHVVSVALPAGVLLSLGLAHAQSAVQLATPPMITNRVPVSAAPTSGAGSIEPLLTTCEPGVRDSSGPGCIRASSVPTLGKLMPLSSLFNVTPAGKVGIGTASPGATLDVKDSGGTSVLTLDGNGGGVQHFFDSGVPAWDIEGNFSDYGISRSGIDFPFYIKYATGNVGIGTQSPGSTLDVKSSSGISDLAIDGNGNAVQRFMIAGAHAWDIEGNFSDYGISRSGIDFPFYIKYATGNVGIATTAPAAGFQLDVAGNIRCVSLTQTSAREFKKDIEPLTGALDSILKLQGVTYSWNDKAPKAVQGHEDIGFIADDVDAVLPEIVSKDENGKVLGLDYGKITPVAVEAIKELNAKNVALEARLAKLEALLAGQTK